MKLRIEKKDAFYVSGYPMETSEETLEKDCAMLREKYEKELRAVSGHLYFASTASKSGTMIYMLSVATTSPAPATKGATCWEIPAASFAIATVPNGAPILPAWYEFFGNGIKSLGAAIDTNYRYNFESYDENGVCELWIPIVKSDV